MVLAEWRRAQQTLGSAELLTREGYHADAVGRTYYALFHAAKAALQVRDVGAETHAGVRRMFGLHLIKPGEIEPEWAVPLGEALDQRLAADYDPDVSFSAKEARAACREARAFLGRIRRYLFDKGFTRSQLRRRRKEDG
ncbi:MAG TPA: HEPN domain-containing protein [Gemmataceae bacterium]|nr:HEPN domain-containing protein [Gemmataceae bacterium]